MTVVQDHRCFCYVEVDIDPALTLAEYRAGRAHTARRPRWTLSGWWSR
jgi:hypothetical protein